ncbi:MAG: hypothetical protein H0V14_01385 [Chitinophagaceae bacterium]|jgi:hypothetical protein|nr:hypothetical protein [Chitinophagaceae bacterium]
MKDIKQGGARQGSGRKKKYGEETVTVAFRVPESKAGIIKVVVNKKLKQFKTVPKTSP